MMSIYSSKGEIRKRYNIGVRSAVDKYLMKRALICKDTVEHIIVEILECWIAQERGRERVKSESVMEEDNVSEEIVSSENSDEYSISTERRSTDSTE